MAASRPLQARARELADQLGAELAEAMAATGTAEPELAAALAVAAYRTVHLQAIRAILAGEEAATVAARQPGRIRSALSAAPLGVLMIHDHRRSMRGRSCVVEAMTMADPLRAPHAGQVAGVRVVGGAVAYGAVPCCLIRGTGA